VPGYLSFLGATPQDILKGYDRHNPFVIIGRILLSLTMLVAIVLNMNPTVKSFLQVKDYFRQPDLREQLVAPTPLPSSRNSQTRDLWRIPVTLSFMVVMAIVAVEVSGIADVIGLLGATVATAMMLAIPAFAMGQILPERGNPLTCLERMQQIALYVFAVVSVSAVPIKILRWIHVLPLAA